MEDMIQIKIAVEGMRAEIIKAFNVEEISAAIEKSTRKAVDEFDMANYIKQTVEGVFYQAGEMAIGELTKKYGNRWADDMSRIIDKKIEQALKG